MRTVLGRTSEWAVTHSAATIAAIISLVAIVGVVGALRLSPDAGTDKLVDHGSGAYEGTQEFRERFGDDAIVVMARGDLQRLVLSRRLSKLLALEGCLAGNVPPGQAEFPAVCGRIADLDATRVVVGPATFLSQALQGAQEQVMTDLADALSDAQQAGRRAARRAARRGLDEAEQAQVGAAAQQAALERAASRFGELAVRAGDLGLPDLSNPQLIAAALSNPELVGRFLANPQFIQGIVFDSRLPSGTPKARFGYLFPSENAALVSLRLEPGLDHETRREAIALIREAVGDEAFQYRGGSYEVSGVPVVVEGLADKLGGEILLLLAVAVVVMALTLLAAFGPPLRLLPLFVALGASALAFGLLSIVGGTLTMASVAVLPVVIGLGVDYAVQLQGRFREAAAAGERPPAAAVIAAVRGGPVIATAAFATSVGFAALLLSPIPMVREFALALVIGILSALAIAVTAGLAALSMVDPARAPRGVREDRPRSAARERVERVAGRLAGSSRAASARAASVFRSGIAFAIAAPGRVLALAAVLAVVGWVAGTRTEVVSDVRELVPQDLPALQSVDALQEEAGVSGELSVIVRGEDVTTTEALAWMGELQERVLAEHGFTGEFPSCREGTAAICPGPALPDLLPNVDEPGQRRIDAVLEAIPDYFLDAILSRPDGEEQIATVSFLIPVMPLDKQEELIASIRGELDPPPGLSAEVVGLPVLAADANAELAGSRYWLTLVALLAVAFVLLAVYRSAGRALVPLIPIVMATGWSALLVEAMAIPLNPMSATLGVLVVAVTTEFSVILSARYREEREAGRSIGDALRLTYSRTGTAVLVSGVTSIAGFGVLVASGITMLRDFGVVTVVDLGVSLLGVMLVLPAALVWAEGGFRPLPQTWARLRRRDEEALPEPSPGGG